MSLPFVSLLVLLFLPLTAFAGTWQARANDPAYACTGSRSNSTFQPPNGVKGSGGSGASITVSGTASFQWTWVSTTTPAEPAPSQVIVTEAVSSSMAFFYGNASLPPVKTTYEAKDRSSGTVTVNVPVSVTATFSTSTMGVLSASASAGLSPVTVSLIGTTKDSSGSDNILVRQGCTASLTGVPGSCTVSNYQ